MKDFSFITNQHPSYIENMYQDFVKDPSSVDPELKKFFEGFDFAMSLGPVLANGGPKETPVVNKEIPGATVITGSEPTGTDWMYDLRAYRLILGYRNKGHLLAKTNPIRSRKDRGANIDLAFYGFSESDLDRTFQAGKLIGLGPTSLQNILDLDPGNASAQQYIDILKQKQTSTSTKTPAKSTKPPVKKSPAAKPKG